MPAVWARTSSSARPSTSLSRRSTNPKTTDRTTVIYIQNDRYVGVPGYESWWDVPVAEVSEMETVRDARAAWEAKRAEERYYL